METDRELRQTEKLFHLILMITYFFLPPSQPSFLSSFSLPPLFLTLFLPFNFPSLPLPFYLPPFLLSFLPSFVLFDHLLSFMPILLRKLSPKRSRTKSRSQGVFVMCTKCISTCSFCYILLFKKRRGEDRRRGGIYLIRQGRSRSACKNKPEAEPVSSGSQWYYLIPELYLLYLAFYFKKILYQILPGLLPTFLSCLPDKKYLSHIFSNA